MRIGFTSIYSYRPHVEHVFFLAQLARKDGHEPFFLTCDAGLSTCYTREFRPNSSRLIECTKCIAGGMRSYPAGPYSSIGRLLDASTPMPEAAMVWGESSVCSMLRTEQLADKNTAQFADLRRRLGQATGEAFRATCAWIEQCRLEALVFFNGRRDATRGVLEAANHMGIPFLSVERTWFGDGLQLIPQDNCLGLDDLDRLNREFNQFPLSEAQAQRTARLMASRFLRKNTLEWRAYNVNAVAAAWPAERTGLKLLFLPSSRYEFDGHPHGHSGWSSNPTFGFDSVLRELGASAQACVLRCHPGWGEKVGRADGHYSEAMYSSWARNNGVRCIGSSERASTQDLIRQADAIVVNGSTAGFEAALLGKPVIGLSPCYYNDGGFQIRFFSPEDRHNLDALSRHDPRQIARMALRCAHTLNFRFYQYVNSVRSVTTTRYTYDMNATSDRFVTALRERQLRAEDPATWSDEIGEDKVLDLILSEQWEVLWAHQDTSARETARSRLKRRLWMRPIDAIREARPRGDF
jgi:hypothetical protein